MKQPQTIKLAHNLNLPMSITTQKVAMMGGNGSGKTYAATKILEEIISAGGWTVILDPVGIYYGLRLDKTGKKPSGLDVPIFGGLHGDVILTPSSGKLIADLICDRRLSVILDVSQFDTDADLNKFATDFGNQFWNRMKANRRAVTLVLEECQEFIPQNPAKGEERKLHVYNRITKIGRNYGIGVMMISARPQDINKKSLNLTQLMFAFQMTGVHERKAMEEWFTYSGYEAKLGGLLPTLEVGEPYVMSPRTLKVNQQVKILPKRTFDASATPDFEDDEQTIALEPIDISKLKEAMHAQIEEAKANDPAELRAQVKRLERELSQARARVPASTVEFHTVEVPVMGDDQYVSLKDVFEKTEQRARELRDQQESLHQAAMDRINTMLADIAKPKELLEEVRSTLSTQSQKTQSTVTYSPEAESVKARRRTFTPPAAYKTDNDIPFPQMRILDTLACLEYVGIPQPRRTIVAFLSDQSPRSSGYTNNLGALRSAGLLSYPDAKSLTLTENGRLRAELPEISRPINSFNLQQAVLTKLSRPQARILEVLIAANGKPVDRELTAERAGQSHRSSGYTNNLGALRSLGLIDYPSATTARALDILWIGVKE